MILNLWRLCSLITTRISSQNTKICVQHCWNLAYSHWRYWFCKAGARRSIQRLFWGLLCSGSVLVASPLRRRREADSLPGRQKMTKLCGTTICSSGDGGESGQNAAFVSEVDSKSKANYMLCRLLISVADNKAKLRRACRQIIWRVTRLFTFVLAVFKPAPLIISLRLTQRPEPFYTCCFIFSRPRRKNSLTMFPAWAKAPATRKMSNKHSANVTEVEEHISLKYEIKKRLGKGVCIHHFFFLLLFPVGLFWGAHFAGIKEVCLHRFVEQKPVVQLWIPPSLPHHTHTHTHTLQKLCESCSTPLAALEPREK